MTDDKKRFDELVDPLRSDPAFKMSTDRPGWLARIARSANIKDMPLSHYRAWLIVASLVSVASCIGLHTTFTNQHNEQEAARQAKIEAVSNVLGSL